MKKTLISVLYLSLVILFLASTGCTPRESILLRDKTCELPCWRGIEINMSVEEVKLKLTAMSGVQSESIRIVEKPNRNVDRGVFFSFDSQDFLDAGFYFQDNQLKVMVFDYAKGRSSRLGYWVEKLGEPSSLILYGGIHTSGILTHSYYYNDLPVCLEGRFYRKHDNFTVKEGTLISEVTLFDPQYDPALINKSCYSSYYQEYMQVCEGYGEYVVEPRQE